LIGEYVEGLKKELYSSKRFELTAIGTFFIGEENTLLFEQDETVNYLTDSFGLTAFNSPAIKREPIERKIEKKLKDKVIVPSREGVPAVPAKRRVSRTLLASAAVLLIAVLLWIPFQSNLKNIDYSSLNPFGPKGEPLYVMSDEAQPDPDGDVTKENVSNMLAMAARDTMRYLNIVIDGNIPIVVKLKDDAKVVPAKTIKNNSKSKNHFHVVGGAFAVAENAEKFLNKLMKAGYDASIIDKKGKALRFVSYGAFATKEEAMQALEKIRAVQQDAWLMMN
jgi:hypothetical protein